MYIIRDAPANLRNRQSTQSEPAPEPVKRTSYIDFGNIIYYPGVGYVQTGKPKAETPTVERYWYEEPTAEQKKQGVSQVRVTETTGPVELTSKTTGPGPVRETQPEYSNNRQMVVTTYTPVMQQLPEKPKTIGQRIAEFNPVQWGADVGESLAVAFGGRKVPEEKKAGYVNFMTNAMGSGIPGVKGTPTQVIGGFVESFETPVYAIGTLAGFEGLPEGQTLSGGLIGSGIQSVMTGKLVATEELKAMDKQPAFAVGTVMGDIALSYVIGKAVSKTAGKVTKIKVEHSYKEAVTANRLWTPSKVDKILMRATGVKTPTLAPNLVGAGEPRPLSMAMLKTGMAGPEEDFFWSMPAKSAQVYVAKPEAKTTSWAVTTLVKKAHLEGVATFTYWPIITEIQEPIPYAIPYVPTQPAFTISRSAFPTLLSLGTGSAILTGTKLVKPSQPTRLMGKTTVGFEPLYKVGPTLNVRQDPLAGVNQFLGVTTRQTQQTRTSLIVVPKAKQGQKQTYKVPTLKGQTGAIRFTPMKIPKPYKGGKISKDVLGIWSGRKHDVKPAKDMLTTFGLGVPLTTHKKSKKKNRKQRGLLKLW